MASDESEEEILKVKKLFKKIKWQHILIAAIIIFAIILRSYHIDYPTIGYHNMKEDQYLSLALNMHETGNYLRTTWFDCDNSLGNYFNNDSYSTCSGNWGETPPAVWTLMLAMGILGWKLWAGRLLIILFSSFSIIPIYLIVKKLSHDNEYISILTAGLYAVLPLAVFFGRNIQMDAPAYFFALMALYFIMKFVDTNKTKDFIIGCTFIVLSAWFKPLLLMIFSAIIFIIPWSTYKRYFKKLKEYKIEIIVAIITIILSTIWLLYIAGAVMPEAKSKGVGGFSFDSMWFAKGTWIDPTFSIFSSSYWTNYKPILFSYFADNYSWLGVALIIIGLILFAINYKSKMSRFIWGYILGIIVYITLLAYKWNAHAYYQYPFLLFAALCIANVFFQAGILIKSFIKNETAKKWLQLLPLIALLLLIAPFRDSTQRVFNTQFFGQDIAGSYINAHTNSSEIFLIERGGQNEVSWTARRFYYAVPDDPAIIQRLEKERNLRYIVMTYSGVSTIQQKKSWQYISENYHIAQVGFVQTAQGPQVYHMVLERGGNFNTSSLSGKPAILAETYEMTYTKIPYYVIEN